MRLIALIAILVVVLLGSLDARAQSPLATGERQAEASETLGPMDRFTVWVYTQQRKFHHQLLGYLQEIRSGGGAFVGWALIGASFLYGVFHAAGPGHGKTVMSGYLLSQNETVRRGVILSVAAAFCQGLVAILIVYGLVGLAGLLPRDTQTAVNWSERASFALVAVLGAMLIFRAARRLYRRRRSATNVYAHHHHHDHAHGDEACCDHVHGPTAEQVEKASDFRTAAAVVLSIGIRPCTGAVIVLVFASATDLNWAGLAAVLAMSAGTAVTVSGLAAAVVGMRNAAWRLPFLSGRGAGALGDAVVAAGGIAILWIGVSLLMASMRPAHPLF
jgi:nickel/cobalt exporter